MAFQIKYGPEVLNEFDTLDNAIDMLTYEIVDMGRPSTMYVYDTEEQTRYDLEDVRL
jgi:hypothetical protein